MITVIIKKLLNTHLANNKTKTFKMNQKVKLSEVFLEWYQQTNSHLYEKNISKEERMKELEEYVNDVLEEHMEEMTGFDSEDAEDPEDEEDEEEDDGDFEDSEEDD